MREIALFRYFELMAMKRAEADIAAYLAFPLPSEAEWAERDGYL